MLSFLQEDTGSGGDCVIKVSHLSLVCELDFYEKFFFSSTERRLVLCVCVCVCAPYSPLTTTPDTEPPPVETTVVGECVQCHHTH